ncbi:MAG: Rossmann-like domain-containing protein [Promethearchaeota archaeon]|jgi:uncharacterized protein (DUF4213/DUF364 family)
MILEKTVKLIKETYDKYDIIPPTLSRVVVGLGYTGVEISSKEFKPILGLASTLSSIINATDCSKIEYAGEVTNNNLSELLKWACESPSLKKVIGIAALNAASQHIFKIKNSYSKLVGELTNYLDINQDTDLTFIGLIKPLIQKLSEKTQRINIIEDTLSTPPEFRQFEFKKSIDNLEREKISTDLLFCTGTALINNSIERILDLFKGKANKIAVIGPTVSLLPDILFDSGVDIVGGMEIVDSERTLRVLEEGGGTKLFKQYGKKYNLINE